MTSTQEVPARQDSASIDDVEKKDVQTSSDEKLGYVETADSVPADNESEQLRLKEVEDLEARLAAGTADDEEYFVRNAHDIAIKVLSTRDDYELPVLTFRMLFLGLGFSAFGSVLAQLYYFKPQTLLVSQGFLLIMLYFFGKAWEKVLPSRGFWWHINPGPFNIKEHCSALIMASTASSSATAIQVISVQNLYYNNNLNPGIAIFTLLGSQLIGYSFAGFLTEALVYPSITFWPTAISPANLFQALHFDGGLSSKRTKLFWLVFTTIFCYEIIPQWIFPLMTGFSIFCLADNTSEVFRNVFGGASNNEGMGLFAFCFDWNLIGSACLYTPLWTQLNQNIGICLTYCLMSAMYYGNIWQGRRFPFMSQAIFDINGNQYNQSAILTNNKFDQAKFEAIGPAYFAASNALYFITANLAMGATLLKPFVRALNPWNKTVTIVHDEHYIVMKRYEKVPRWWFVALLVAAYAMAQATDYTGDSHFTWWQLTVVLIISLVFTMAYCTTSAILGFAQFSTQLDGFYSMIASYMVPGDPIANMYAALYGSQPTVQGILLLGDLKLGQYIKIPPKINFLVQILGCVVGALLNYVMELSIVRNQRAALLTIAGTRLWSGQNAQSFNSNAIAWGALGREMFSPGKTYYMVPVALALGALMPIPHYFLHRKFPKNQFLANFNTGIVMQYSCFLSVGINSSVNTSTFLGIMSQWWVRRKYPRWFTKYNYIIAGSLDGGTQVISFILNLAIFGAAGPTVFFPNWWGNDFSLSADRCAPPPDL
ncbi:OPT oligopeptide transporter protein-domain-containing protein [Rhodocollybia butyracea]|uniref:OPT oligopeptide transporter protein-domain-containing protein n=1 Tax=Rhodocollybia butyracea TaxID=206335 RepID=A0A9P5Q5B6_9AGAR|nr:OPT oligopeptide transporter protein-domain-containing protein [Rhodocollybia butyracea]